MKTFYRIDPARITWREYAFETSWLLMPLAALVKLRWLRTSSSTDDPAVESIVPFEVEEAVPAEVRERFAPMAQELEALGFGQPIYHQIYHPLYATHIYWATFLHPSGRAVARIHHRVWSRGALHKSYLFPLFISQREDGSFLVSSAGRPDMLTPASVPMVYQTGASATELWQHHERRLDNLLPCRPVTVDTPARLRELIEQHHGALRDFHLDRGVFAPIPEAEQERLAARCEAPLATKAPPSTEEAVLARLERAPLERPSWRNGLLLLVISLVLFLGAGIRGAPTRFLWILIPVLLFHELGHYVAMKGFGYRNMRMFFIPFLGAAVMGKHYNVSGWKKAVVALMGPLPGILIGAGLGFASTRWHRPLLMEIALLLVILNGLNLVPFLPLDGGWVMHAVLFCRHPLLDLAARALGIVVLFGLALLGDRWLALLGIVLLITLPTSWHIARVAHRLRRKGISTVSLDTLSIPPPTASVILAELGAGKHNRMPANVLAQQVTRVFETLNARPPGILASLALLATHAAGFLGALALLVVFTGGPRGFLHRFRFFRSFTDPTPYAYTPGETQDWRGAAAPAWPPAESVTLLAHYKDARRAQAQFAVLPAELPDRATLRWFGRSLLVTLPEDDEAETGRWEKRLRQQARDVSPLRKNSGVSVNFACVLPSTEKAEQLQQEIEDYLAAPQNELLLAPWSAAWQALPPEDQQRFRKARRTLRRIRNLDHKAMESPEVRAHLSSLGGDLRQRDPDTYREKFAAFHQVCIAEQKRLLAEITAEGEETVDPAVVELWQRRTQVIQSMTFLAGNSGKRDEKQKVEQRQRQLKGLQREMAALLGSLPLMGDKPRPGTNADSARGGYVIRKEASLTIDSMLFSQLDKGLPTFAEWLGQQGGSQIRYGIDIPSPDPADEGDPE